MSVLVFQSGLIERIARRIFRHKRSLLENLPVTSDLTPFMVYPNLQEMLQAFGVSVVVSEDGKLCIDNSSFSALPDSLSRETAEVIAEAVGRLIADTLTQEIGNGKWKFSFGHDGDNEYVIYASPVDN